ncbi:hypothetical protein O7606_15090 [Micromonospora sp. WMMD882]|uniref:hypothetical protein n=1 Tax=Micromonospora sp. WMMD882 TaxID=3015151 RepID=UPI00248D17BF|nr:hypothetical protein [Micromonospora sp. WMMD882]WBB77608.1 hypothetical protein O7606_15090 [Micromonospora sp. WMMD882]
MSEEALLHFLVVMQANKNSHERQVGRNSLAMLLAACAFELLARGMVAEVSLLGIKIKSLSVATMLIPLIAAFIFDRISMSFIEALALQDALIWIVSHRFPSLHEKELLMAATSSDTWASSRSLDSALNSKWLDRINTSVAVSYGIVVTVGATAFLVYANTRLFFLPENTPYLLATSIVATTFFMVTAIARLVLFVFKWPRPANHQPSAETIRPDN